MKKLVLMFVAIAAVSFASCGNKAADAEKATAAEAAAQATDTIAADAEKATAAEAAAQATDTIAADTTVVTETVVAE